MSRLRIFIDKRKGKERFFVGYKKEILSGPWQTQKEAVQSKQEWLFGG